MSGKDLYRHFESGGGDMLTAWEHLTNEQRFRWESTADAVHDDIYESVYADAYDDAEDEIRERIEIKEALKKPIDKH